jgi:hypothetical protein
LANAEHLPAADESVIRIEILDGEFLYAIRLQLLSGSFNRLAPRTPPERQLASAKSS